MTLRLRLAAALLATFGCAGMAAQNRAAEASRPPDYNAAGTAFSSCLMAGRGTQSCWNECRMSGYSEAACGAHYRQVQFLQ
jgi:hypothetical protein